MPDQIPTKPTWEKIADAIAATEHLVQPGHSLQTVSDQMVALDVNMLPRV